MKVMFENGGRQPDISDARIGDVPIAEYTDTGFGPGCAKRREAVMRLIGQGCDDEAIARCLNLTSNGTAIRCDDGQPWTPERVRSYRRGAGL